MPNNRRTHEWFVEQADLIYGKDTFIYLERYETARKPIMIKCTTCGREFKRVPNLHLRQPYGCISCSKITERKSTISQEQHEIIEGLLVSDASLWRQQTTGQLLTTPIFGLKSITEEFIDYTRQILPLEFSKNSTSAGESVAFNSVSDVICNRKECFVLQSKSDHALVPYWERWYNGNVKHIPSDFVLTPTTARFWYYGDGSSSIYSTGENDTSRVTVRFCTHSFTWDDCERLCGLWETVGVPFHVVGDKDKPVLTINKADYITRFFEYLGEPEIESFRYKWKSPNHSARTRSV